MKPTTRIRLLIPTLVALLTLITYFLPIKEDYRINLFTELIGVFVTVILVDYLYRIESKKEEQDNEDIRLLSLDSILSIYIDKYLENLNIMTSDKFSPDRDMTQIAINDLQYIYDGAFLSFRPFFIKKYTLYFDSLDKLTEVVKQTLPAIDAKYNRDLIYLLQTFTMSNDIHYLREMIEERTQITYGKDQGWKKDVEVLKAMKPKEGDEKTNYSSSDLYVQFFKSIELNIGLINTYKYRMRLLKDKHGFKKDEEKQ